MVRTIGQIATGTVLTHDILQVRSHPNVSSLKLANRLYPALEFSVPDIEATPAQLAAVLPSNVASPDGAGVIVGIIDYGCDFNHRNFRHANGASRILYLWNQVGWSDDGGPAPFGYGIEYRQTQIDQALKSPSPYNALGYLPGRRATAPMSWISPRATVEPPDGQGWRPTLTSFLSTSPMATWSGEAFFGNSRRLLEAVDYIFLKAAELGKPAVINISLGTHGGPHDGTSLLEEGLDTLLRDQTGRAIVISAGNSWDDNCHASGAVEAGSPRTVTWHIPDQDVTENELEIWYPGVAELSLTLITPWGLRLGPVPPGAMRHIDSESGPALGYIAHRQRDPNNGENDIDIFLSPMLPAGDWAVETQHTKQRRPSPSMPTSSVTTPGFDTIVFRACRCRPMPHDRLNLLWRAAHRRRLLLRWPARESVVSIQLRRPNEERPSEAGGQRAGIIHTERWDSCRQIVDTRRGAQERHQHGCAACCRSGGVVDASNGSSPHD